MSVNVHLRCINAYFNWLHKEHGKELVRIPKLKEEQKILATLSSEAIKNLINARPTKGQTLLRAWLVALTILDTGLRASEVLGLTKQNINLDELTFRVFGKGGKHRLIPFSVELRKSLFRFLQRNNSVPDNILALRYIFGTKHNTKVSVRNLERDFKVLGQKLGISGLRFSPHTLRHTFAVCYLRAGGNPEFLRRILGHSSLVTTQKYLKSVGGLIFVIRHQPHGHSVQAAAGGVGSLQNTQSQWSNVPVRTFADVGGMEKEKRRIAVVVNNRLHPERFKQHGVEQNGILLYGPRGTGKTFLAETVAGEFRMNYWYVRPTSLMECRIGSSEANIRSQFAEAYAHRPVLFFLDEVDSIGTQRQELTRNSDPTGSGKLYNAVVTELMQCIDQYRRAQGFVIMAAATNFYEGLDEALIRDLRFDEKIRVDLPDGAARTQILAAQLSRRLGAPFALDRFANRTPGWSAAKLAGLVNKAASIAASENRQIEERDLQQAFDESGGQDRPLLKAVNWSDLVLPA